MELSVNADDLGKVIGKNGQTARAIRTIVNAAADLPIDTAIIDCEAVVVGPGGGSDFGALQEAGLAAGQARVLDGRKRWLFI